MQENITTVIKTSNAASEEAIKQRLMELHDFITQNPQMELIEFDDPLVRRLLQKVTVYDDYYTVEFKSEVSVEVEA